MVSGPVKKILYVPLIAAAVYGGHLAYEGHSLVMQRNETTEKELEKLTQVKRDLDSTKSKLTNIAHNLDIKKIPYNSDVMDKLNGSLSRLESSGLSSSRYYCNEALKEVKWKIKETEEKEKEALHGKSDLGYYEELGGVAILALSLAGIDKLNKKKKSE
jgi:hypothetical protein